MVQEPGDRGRTLAQVVTDLVKRLALEMSQDDRCLVVVRQLGQRSGKLPKLLIALRPLTGRRLVRSQVHFQLGRRFVKHSI